MTTKELKTVKSLMLNKEIRILQAENGNCTVVFDESKYKEELNILLECGVYEPFPKDPTAKVERKIQKLLSKNKISLPIDLKHKLTPYDSKPQHLYGLPKIYKPDTPLRPIVSSIGYPCWKIGHFIKNSGHFVQLLKSVNLQSPDTLVRFNVVSLFTKVPVDEILQVTTVIHWRNGPSCRPKPSLSCWRFA
jgi:hypothetical protein